MTPKTIQTLYEGPHEGGKKQVCMMHAETYDKEIVLKAAPGGEAMKWWVPPVWKTVVDGEEFIKGNPILNKQNQLVWLLVRDVK